MANNQINPEQATWPRYFYTSALDIPLAIDTLHSRPIRQMLLFPLRRTMRRDR